MSQNLHLPRKSMTFLLDCLAVLAGLMIAAPFVLVAASPFFGGL